MNGELIVRRRVGLRHARRESVHFTLRLSERHALTQAAKGQVVFHRRLKPSLINGHRNPEITILGRARRQADARRKNKLGRHDPHHRGYGAVEADGAPNYAFIAAEAGPPESMTQHHQPDAGVLIAGRQWATAKRLDS